MATEMNTRIGTVGERLRMARSERGLTSAEVAIAVNVSAPQVLRWERDRVYPRIDEALDLCRALNISIEWLLDGVGADSMASLIEVPGGFRTESR